ncbi:MAG TPA: hypothetical protein VI564_08260 [Candidatus Nanoarchaeia archaeon]|nr:hypothetical protein [Candidatus Nanoarchaeia archaeon]
MPEKKGVFFTLISITIMAILIIIFSPSADYGLKKNQQSDNVRIGSVDQYIEMLETSYFEIVLRSSTLKAVTSLIYYSNQTGSYVKNLDSSFYEVMLNGTINGVAIDSVTGKKIMTNNTVKNWSKKMESISKQTLNVVTIINVTNISLSQSNPWTIESTMRMNITVQSNVATWNKESVIKSEISIEGLYDPQYLLHTSGLYGKKVRKSGVEFNKWNVTKVEDGIRNGTYVHWISTDAPSFIQRIKNDSTPSACCGIESFADPNQLSPNDQFESYVDYNMWNHNFSSCSVLYNITNPSTGGGVWSNYKFFKLDLDHLVRYNITPENYITC